MARGRKKEALTPEERLQAALVPESEQPYKVPENWCWTRLGSLLSEIKNGTTIKQDKSGIGYKVTRIESLQNQTIDFGRLGTIVNEQEIKDTDWYCAGDIALSHINSAEHVGKTALINVDMLPLVHGMNLLRLRFYSKCCLPILFQYFSQSFQYKDEILSRINMAVNQVSINQKQLSSLEFPLPPLPEQERIVDRIEILFAKLDEAKQKAQDALDNFETRKAAILHKAFTGELTARWRKEHDYNLNWEEYTIGDLFSHTTGKALKKGNTTGTLHKYITTSNLYWGRFDFSEVREMYFTDKELEKCTAKKGDLLVCNGGDVGRSAVWIYDYDICLQNHISKLRPKIGDISVRFFYYFFLNSKNKGYINGRGIGISSLSAKDLLSIKVLLPTLLEQTEIVRILDSLLVKEQQAKEAAETVLEQIDLIKKAILARAFRGELGTNDPAEESAVDLLKESM